MLARLGVKRLRIIDFDVLTYSSLNRHSVGTLLDIGKSKVDVMKDHILEFAPDCIIETKNVMLCQDNIDDLLNGSPNYICDCIDDINTKLSLITHCIKNNYPIISSLGAGAKIDPTKIFIGKLPNVTSIYYIFR